MIDRCCYIKEGKKYIHIPGCMGAAAMGPDHCTCQTTEERVKVLEKWLEGHKARLLAIEHWIETHDPDHSNFVNLMFDRASDEKQQRKRDDWVADVVARTKPDSTP